MKTAILFHSKTGHTRFVAEQLQQSLAATGRPADLLEVRAVNGNVRDAASVQLEPLPETASYDLLVFATPVWGGRLSTVMQACLLALPSLEGKQLMGFVTQSFPRPVHGRNPGPAEHGVALRRQGRRPRENRRRQLDVQENEEPANRRNPPGLRHSLDISRGEVPFQ